MAQFEHGAQPQLETYYSSAKGADSAESAKPSCSVLRKFISRVSYARGVIDHSIANLSDAHSSNFRSEFGGTGGESLMAFIRVSCLHEFLRLKSKYMYRIPDQPGLLQIPDLLHQCLSLIRALRLCEGEQLDVVYTSTELIMAAAS